LRGSAAKDTGVDEASESHSGDVTTRAMDAFEVPDCFGSAEGEGG
jgi:hypothetical protein